MNLHYFICLITVFCKNRMLNPFSTNVPIMDKPGWWICTSKLFEKHQWKSDILSKDAGRRTASLLKMSLFHICFSNILLVKTNYLFFFKHFASKNPTTWFLHKENIGRECLII